MLTSQNTYLRRIGSVQNEPRGSRSTCYALHNTDFTWRVLLSKLTIINSKYYSPPPHHVGREISNFSHPCSIVGSRSVFPKELRWDSSRTLFGCRCERNSLVSNTFPNFRGSKAGHDQLKVHSVFTSRWPWMIELFSSSSQQIGLNSVLPKELQCANLRTCLRC